MIHKFSVSTRERTQFINIDSDVRRIIDDSGIKDGYCIVFVPHTTVAVTINENADPDVVRDMIMATSKIVPFSDGYRHAEGNSAAHIKASFFVNLTDRVQEKYLFKLSVPDNVSAILVSMKSSSHSDCKSLVKILVSPQ